MTQDVQDDDQIQRFRKDLVETMRLALEGRSKIIELRAAADANAGIRSFVGTSR
jgi:hypothetical protein